LLNSRIEIQQSRSLKVGPQSGGSLVEVPGTTLDKRKPLADGDTELDVDLGNLIISAP
jgi:hypothetical protein